MTSRTYFYKVYVKVFKMEMKIEKWERETKINWKCKQRTNSELKKEWKNERTNERKKERMNKKRGCS